MVQPQATSEKQALPYFAGSDIGLALTEPVHAVLARVLSPDANSRIIARLGPLATRLRAGKRRHLERVYAQMIGQYQDRMPASPDYVTSLITTQLEQRMIYARLARHPNWRPKMQVTGTKEVSAALDDGRGVVFWILPQELTAILLRMQSIDRSWSLHHLSHWSHGQSTSRFGIATFNRRDCRIEDQFSTRIRLDDQTTRRALSQAAAVLRGGDCVSVRGIGWSGRTAYFPLFDGYSALAFGAPVLARRTGAQLFTVSTRDTGQGYELQFKALPVAPPRPLNDIGSDFMDRLQSAAIETPRLWPAKSRQWAPGNPPDPFSVARPPAPELR